MVPTMLSSALPRLCGNKNFNSCLRYRYRYRCTQVYHRKFSFFGSTINCTAEISEPILDRLSGNRFHCCKKFVFLYPLLLNIRINHSNLEIILQQMTCLMYLKSGGKPGSKEVFAGKFSPTEDSMLISWTRAVVRGGEEVVVKA